MPFSKEFFHFPIFPFQKEANISGFSINCLKEEGFRKKLANLCYENNMFSTEFLLQFSDESCLYFLVVPELRHWNKDNDSLLPLNINFLK